ncbi:dirigent protein 20-like [Triticum dicoccoides]|uniref:dirigent protein 20-like n=1 Tax=Triticum dicoccoides TaxID=85692 RepID=UPI0018918EFA|nr:dirigent protein 20-like [Triticum dicoccoides]
MTAPLLTLVLLLLTSSAAVACASADPKGDLKRIRVYMHETMSGPNATLLTSVQSPLGGSATFGQIGVLDNELRDGLHRGSSSPLGRFQGLFAMTGLANTPGLLSAVDVVFTGGKYQGSTLAMLGTIQDLRASVERTVVGGTGAFRMARGYSSMVYIPEASTANNDVYRIDFFVDV